MIVARASVLQHPGEPSRIEELTVAPPRAGEVLVRMVAAGVCHSDLHVRDGDWPRPGPIALGHEGAGVVEAVGEGEDPALVGRTVALSWYVPCLRCRACQAGRQWLCTGSSSLRHAMPDGTSRFARADGSPVLPYCGIATFASWTVVPVEAAIPMPEGVPAEVAALIGCCVSTGVGAVTKTAAVRPGETVVVIGLGGVGMSCVMGAALAGAARVVAVDRVAAKVERARSFGATAGIVAGDDPAATVAAIRDATDGGPDHVFEAIGRVPTVELAIEAAPPGGTVTLVGLTPFGQRASFDVFPFVDGSGRLLGSNYGFAVAATDFPRYGRLYLDGRLPIDRLIDRRLPLDDLEDAFATLRRGEVLRQVVVHEH